MSTLSDVAATAGVSPSTASRVLNGKGTGFISEATAERVRQAAEELGYRPSAAARSLVTGYSNTVAFCCTPTYDSAMAELVRAVHDATKAAGYHMLLVDSDDIDELRQLLVERRVDAIVWTHYPIHEADALTEHFAAPHQAVIAVGEINGEVPVRVHSAFWDDCQGMHLLLEHLRGLGHSHVAYLGGCHPGNASKLLGFEHARSELGLRGDVIWCADETDRIGAGVAMVSEVLGLRERPTALVARHNDFALGAIRALEDAGLVVPDDMSVAGYHESWDIAHSRPPLTTVRTPELDAVSLVLPDILAALADAPGADELTSLRLDLQLVVRQSTSAPRGAKTPKG
jgi:DNA-binding LacI/PurR family transcriptional regulator